MPMTYDSLTEDIILNAQRTDPNFIVQVSTFIERAINKLYTEIEDQGLVILTRENAQYGLRAGQTNVQKKPNWQKTISLSYTDANNNLIPLLPCSYEFALSYWPNARETATPLFYAELLSYNYAANAMGFYIAPTPNLTATITHLWIPVPLFNNANQTNAITERYPDLLFYGSMLQAMTYLKDDNRIATFDKLYTSALARVNTQTKDRFVDRTVKRDEI